LGKPDAAPAVDAPKAEPEEQPEAVAPEPEADGTGEEAGSTDDLDALLASLNEPAPPAEEGETEVDLDALLASL